MDHPPVGDGVETGLTQNATIARRRRWHHRRDLRFLIVVGAVLAAYYGYGFTTSFERVTDRLQARLAQGPARVNITITTRFAPEAFHMGLYQEYGSLRGTKGNTALLFRVKPSNVDSLSRRYWITEIDLIPSKR